jgi:multiple sugar transport system permease protein
MGEAIRVRGARPTLIGRARTWLEGSAFPYVLIAPMLITLVLVGVIPFLYTVYLSLHDTEFTRVEGFAGLSNFTELLSDDKFWKAMGVTAVILAVAVPLQLGLGLGFALLFSRGVFGARILSPALLIPSVVAPTVAAMVWKIMLAPSWGFATYEVIERFNLLPGTSVFSEPSSAIAAIILIDVWQWTPFVTLAVFAALQALPLGPYRAAAVDGASRWYTFRYITLPGVYPILAVLLLIRIIDTFKIFDTIYILTGGGPNDSTQAMSVYLYKNVFDYYEVGLAAAAAVIIFVLFFIVSSLIYRLFSKTLKLF